MMKFSLAFLSAALAVKFDSSSVGDVMATVGAVGGQQFGAPPAVQANVSKRTFAMQMSSSNCTTRCSDHWRIYQDLVKAAEPLPFLNSNLGADGSALYGDFEKLCKSGCNGGCNLCKFTESNLKEFDLKSDLKNDTKSKADYISFLKFACKTGKTQNAIPKDLCNPRFNFLTFDLTPLKEAATPYLTSEKNLMYDLWSFFLHGCGSPKNLEQCTTIAGAKYDALTSIGDMSHVKKNNKEDYENILKLACRVGKGEGEMRAEWMRAELERAKLERLKCLTRCSTSKLQSLVDAAKPLMRDTTNLAAHISRGCLDACKNSNACTFDGNSDVKADNKADYNSIIKLACKTGNNTIGEKELCSTRSQFKIFGYKSWFPEDKKNNMRISGLNLLTRFLHGCDAPKKPEQCTTIADKEIKLVFADAKEDEKIILKLACRVGQGETPIVGLSGELKCLTRCSASKLQLWARAAYSLLKDPTETVAPNHKIAKEMIDSTLLEKCKAACHSTSAPDCSKLAKNLDQTDSRAMHLVQDGNKDCFKSIIKGACELGYDNGNTSACNFSSNFREVGEDILHQVTKKNCQCGDQLAVCGQWCRGNFGTMQGTNAGDEPSKQFSICTDLPWKNCFGHTCKELSTNPHAQADWVDAKQLKAGQQCCSFGGGTIIDTRPCPRSFKDAKACQKVTGCKYTAAVAAVAGQAAECKFKASCSATTEEKCKAVTGCTFNQNKKKCEYPASPNFCKIDLTSIQAKIDCEFKGCEFTQKVNGVGKVAAKCEK